MEEKETIKISRSFTRKVNLGNYESVDFYSSRSQEIPADTDLVQQYHLAQELSALAIADVEESIKEYLKLRDEGKGVGINKLVEMIDCFASDNKMLLEDHDNLSPKENKIIQATKRAVNRAIYQEQHKKEA